MVLYFSCILLAGLTYKTKLFNIHTTLMSTNSLIFFLSFLLLTSSAYQSVALSFQSIVLFVSAMPLLLILQYLTPVFEYFSPLDIKQSLFQFFLSNRLWYLHQKTSYCWHQFFVMGLHDLLCLGFFYACHLVVQLLKHRSLLQQVFLDLWQLSLSLRKRNKTKRNEVLLMLYSIAKN